MDWLTRSYSLVHICTEKSLYTWIYLKQFCVLPTQLGYRLPIIFRILSYSKMKINEVVASADGVQCPSFTGN